MPFNPEKPEAEPAPSSDPEINEMLEKLGKIIEENPKKENPRSGIHSTIKIHEDAEYEKARRIIREREEREKAKKDKKPRKVGKKTKKYGNTLTGNIGEAYDRMEQRIDGMS